MKTTGIHGTVARRVAATALVVAASAGPVRAQVGIGITAPGAVPFLYYTPQNVPSPTDYLYDRDRARMSAYGNAARQQAAPSQVAAESGNPNAYYNRIRSYSGEETYHVESRQSLGRRTSPAPQRTTSRTTVLPLDAYFLQSGPMDWPRDAPDTAALHPARVEAEAAVRAVRDELRTTGKAKAQSVGMAKRKLVNYGQRALVEVKSARSETVAVLFHYFLLFLDQSLDQAAETKGS